MQEKVITIASERNQNIVGLIIVEEIELGYIKDKIVIYATNELKEFISSIIESLGQTYMNIPTLMEKVSYGLKTDHRTSYMRLLEPFALESENKNKSSRNKRMIDQMKLDNKLERGIAYVGKKNS